MFAEATRLNSHTPVCILLTSRRASYIEMELKRLENSPDFRTISLENLRADYKTFIEQELMWSEIPHFSKSITERLLSTAQNSFLWISLTVDRINSCHTEEAVEDALLELPPGMEELYHRMACSVADHSKADVELALGILLWVTCARRRLSLAELEQALGIDSQGKILNPQRSIPSLCAGFVVIDHDGFVSLNHRTAADYLLDDNGHDTIKVITETSHETILLRCLSCLTPSRSAKKLSAQPPDFTIYSATFWATHLAYCSPKSTAVLHALSAFLGGQGVLYLIEVLAQSDALQVLLQVAVHLSVYHRKRQIYESGLIPTSKGSLYSTGMYVPFPTNNSNLSSTILVW